MSDQPSPLSDWTHPATTTVLLGGVILSLAAFFIYDKYRYKNVWAQYGVKQPNLSSLGFLSARRQLDENLRQYGDTIGMYRSGQGPLLLTRDLGLLRNILVKDFNNYVDRALPLNSASPLASSVFFAKGASWRRIRHITSPSFSTGKLKAISKNVNESAETLAEFCLTHARTGRLLSLKKTTAQYTSEIIARTTFGLKTDAIGDDENQFTQMARGIIKIRGKLVTYLLLAIRSVPGLMKVLINYLRITFFDPVSTDSLSYFSSILKKTLPERRQAEKSGGRKPVDLLQALVASQTVGSSSSASKSNGTATGIIEDSTKPMTDEEILGQSLLIIFAGFETTASTLQMALYMMAQYPDIQDKVYQEITSVVKSSIPTHEELIDLKYTEQVINETLRVFPIVPLVTREAAETKTYDGITIPKGTQVLVSISGVLSDPKTWPNPEVFDPDRFTEEAKAARDPMAFMSFGLGPRQCLGMRLAYLELKVGLVHVLRKVKFELNSNTEPKKGSKVSISWQGLLSPEKPIQIACVARE